jgi:hypothetical protein
MELQANGVRFEASAGQPGSADRVLALLDVRFRRTALIAEGDDPVGGAGQVGDDKANPRVQLSWMPFRRGHHTPRLHLAVF